MTPKEKAKELVLKFAFKGAQHEGEAKQFVLIVVNEIIDLLPNINLIPPIQRGPDEFYRQYWCIVKKEIEKL